MSASDSDRDPAILSQLERTVRENMPPPRRGIVLPSFPHRADRLRGALETMGVWVTEIDGQGTLTYTSPLVERILGFTPDEYLTNRCVEFHPDDLHTVVESGQNLRATGQPVCNQTRMRHKNGHWVWIENTVIGWTDEHGAFNSLVYGRDISDIKDAQAHQRESETRYNVVSQMSCDLITEMDLAGRYTYVDQGAEAILGYSQDEILDLEPWALLHPDERETVLVQFEKQLVAPHAASRSVSNVHPIEARLRHKDGRWLWFEIRGVTYARADGETRYLAVNHDVSERVLTEQTRRELQESMQRAQKLESLGVLAGGIAHDFNNLLTPILGAAGLGLMELPDDSPLRTRLQMIQRAAKRAAALTNQMLAYVGQKSLRVELIDLTSIVEDMRDLVASSLSSKATVDLKLERDLPLVEGESAQLSQIVMNLISNASESLDNSQGQLTIRTGQATLTSHSNDVVYSNNMPLGECVFFEVLDNGCGMKRETLDRIFDPFYTTKHMGRGLGLSAVSGIVRGHSGGIEVESRPGEGTRFRVMFPVAAKKRDEVPRKEKPRRSFALSGTALLIDDDAAVLELSCEVLRNAGMQVLTACDGPEGVNQVRTASSKIDVVLLDRTMPGLSGAETLEAIVALRSDIDVILVSGYSEERLQEELGTYDLAGYLEKPFLPETLLDCVRKVLDSKRSRT